MKSYLFLSEKLIYIIVNDWLLRFYAVVKAPRLYTFVNVYERF